MRNIIRGDGAAERTCPWTQSKFDHAWTVEKCRISRIQIQITRKVHETAGHVLKQCYITYGAEHFML